MYKFDKGWTAQSFQQLNNIFGLYVMHWPLNISQNGVPEHHGMAELQIADFFNGGVTGLFQLANARNELHFNRTN